MLAVEAVVIIVVSNLSFDTFIALLAMYIYIYICVYPAGSKEGSVEISTVIMAKITLRELTRYRPAHTFSSQKPPKKYSKT